MKKCNKCFEVKETREFFADKNHPSGFYSICKVCKKEATYKWREKNRDKYNGGAKRWRKRNPDKVHARELKRLYGCTPEQYQSMLAAQNFCCAICNKKHDPEVKRGKLYVDHDHETKKIRSLLCGMCNSLLGYAKDQTQILNKAIDYLKLHRAANE